MNSRNHLKAFATNFETACIVGAISLIADMYWLIHDICNNGFSIHYGIVGIGLLIGIVGTTYVICKHHISKINKYKSRK